MLDIGITGLILAMGAFGFLVVMLIIFAESGLLVGFFLPGDTLLFTAGFLASRNVFGFNVNIMIALLFIAAVSGDSVGYWFGYKVGPRVFRHEKSLFFDKDNLLRAEKFYERYGPITIFFARFIPIVRTFAPIVAGVGKMRYRTFVIFNLLGGLAWTTVMVYFGYFAGAFFAARGIKVEQFILPIIGCAVLITLGSPLLHILINKDNRAKLLEKLKHLR